MLWELIVVHWPQILAVVTFVIWLTRLERTVNANKEELKRQGDTTAKEFVRLETKIDKDNARRDERRREDMQAINATLFEMRADIKQLLTRGNYGTTDK